MLHSNVDRCQEAQAVGQKKLWIQLTRERIKVTVIEKPRGGYFSAILIKVFLPSFALFLELEMLLYFSHLVKEHVLYYN
jgi:hypothetical protein